MFAFLQIDKTSLIFESSSAKVVDIKIFFDPEYYLVSSTMSGPILNYLNVSGARPVYKFNIINTDMQQSKMVDINIVNVTDEALNDWSEYVNQNPAYLDAIWTS